MMWKCSRCTFDNRWGVDDLRCGACDAEAPARGIVVAQPPPSKEESALSVEDWVPLAVIGQDEQGVPMAQVASSHGAPKSSLIESTEARFARARRQAESALGDKPFSAKYFIDLSLKRGWASSRAQAIALLQEGFVDSDIVHRVPYTLLPVVRDLETEHFKFGQRFLCKPKRSQLAERAVCRCSMCGQEQLVFLLSTDSGCIDGNGPGANKSTKWTCSACTFENSTDHADLKGQNDDSDIHGAQGLLASSFAWVSTNAKSLFMSKDGEEAAAASEKVGAEAAQVRAAIAKAILENNDSGKTDTPDSLGLHHFLAKDKRARYSQVQAQNDNDALDCADSLLTTYAPLVMRHLRHFSGVSEDFFASSLLDHAFLEQQGGGGRSGATLFFSSDKNFFVKSLVKSECKALLRLLHRGLFEHFQKYPSTLLPRVFGLFKVRAGGLKRYFLVSNNAFNSSLTIDRVFDLKGSTSSRFVDEKTQRQTVERTGRLPTLKDLNWHEGDKVSLGPSLRADLVDQLERDTLFLEKNNVMDYSLLVGIHQGPLDPSSREGVSPIPRTCFQRDFGGIRCERTGSVYYICLIDILQHFDTSKMVERFVKTRVLAPLKAMADPGKVECPSCLHAWQKLPDRTKYDLHSASRVASRPSLHNPSSPLESYQCPKCGHTFQTTSTTDTNISSVQPAHYRARFLHFVTTKVLV